MSYDPKLLRIFAAEQAEHTQHIRDIAERLAHAPPEEAAQHYDELLRRAHTLKGAARAVGIERTERLSHAIETMFGRLRAAELRVGGRALDALRQALEAAEDALSAAIGGRPEPDVSSALAALETVSENSGEPDFVPAAPSPPAVGAEPTLGLVRVSAERIDEVVRATAQMAEAAAGAAADARRAERSREIAGRLETTWAQLRRVAALYGRGHREDPEFAPVLDSLGAVDDVVREIASDAVAAAVARRRHAWALDERARELHADVSRVRMVTADSVFGGFGSMLRDLARAEGKQIDYRAEGLGTHADRLILQGLKVPVMHLLRNAVTHGIEAPSDRERAGKRGPGLVNLRVGSRGDRLDIVVEDDGRGLDLTAIANAAAEKGLLRSTDGQTPTPDEAARLILQPGFSTASRVTELAGRGFGLSAARETALSLGGDITVRPGRESGTRVTLSVPLSISTQRVVLLEAAGQTVGLPAAAVERLWRGPVAEVRTIEGREAIVLDGAPMMLARLGDLLDLTPARPHAAAEPDRSTKLHIVALVSEGERAGLVVDRFLDGRDAVVKSTGLPGALAGLSAGAVPLEDRKVAVILNASALMDRFRASGASPGVAAPRSEPKAKPRILVVDDSLTTRSLEKSILEAHGYDVRVAVDGLQALEELRNLGADLVITDVMMPRMDGLQLLSQMKAEPPLAQIPVVMVTSLERREDQERGLSLGADAYIVKRKFDQRELLDTVRQIL